MMLRIESLNLKRFRSIVSAHVVFANPVFLVGRNGSGKSNLIDAFDFLAEAMASPLQAVFDKRGGITVVRNRTSGAGYPPNLGMKVGFGPLNGNTTGGSYAFEVKALPNYGFEVLREQCILESTATGRAWFDRQKTEFRCNVKGLEPSLNPAALALPVVGGNERFALAVRTLAEMRTYSIEPSKVREMQDPDSGISLKSDGSNAASVLQEIWRQSKQDFDRICEILPTIVPNTMKVRTTKQGNKLSLVFTQEWQAEMGRKSLSFESFSMSDGTLRALGLLTAVYQRPRPALLAIEEPEATIHPGALGAILDVLRDASRTMQVVITTHSPEVLDAKWITGDSLRIVEWLEGATTVKPVSEASREALRQHLMGAGDLLRSDALTAEPLFETSPEQASLFQDISA